MKKDDKFKCLKTVNNLLGQPLFIKGETYTVLYVDGDDDITLNHILYANEYRGFSLRFINEHFEKI